MKKVIAAVYFALAASAANAQIPVTDGASIAQDMANQMQTMMQWAQQLAEMKAQYDQMQMDYEQMLKDYEAITGTRNYGSILYDYGLAGKITDPTDVYANNGRTPPIISEEQGRANNGTVEQVQADIIERDMNTAASHKAATLYAYEGAKSRLTQIESLMARINTTQDPKAIQELQARIGIEQAALANEQNKLQLISQAQKAEMDLIKQQRATLNRRIMNPANSGMPSIN